jgi:hypothetical protein
MRERGAGKSTAMNFAQIEQALLESSRADWNRLPDESAVFKPDVRISLRIDSGPGDELRHREAWSKTHADPHAALAFVKIKFNGEVIDVWDCVWVDGWRALIPQPDCTLPADSLDTDPPFGWTLSQRDFARGRFLSHFTTHEFERYVKTCGLGVEGDPSYERREYDAFLR